ncbi:hypothetical protein LUX29_20110 [Aureimonas altamirensis]|uniref:hypothetical protein n=1 Tax=Aureimonas altamirensis TaxID=370622 RepID=UPI001E5720BC|nr:hypothetical protein [Aureimonas altamirensis]UHD45278.1 hypothetical protein LUX29_20110 [Aureimonas altamirensis]
MTNPHALNTEFQRRDIERIVKAAGDQFGIPGGSLWAEVQKGNHASRMILALLGLPQDLPAEPAGAPRINDDILISMVSALDAATLSDMNSDRKAGKREAAYRGAIPPSQSVSIKFRSKRLKRQS